MIEEIRIRSLGVIESSTLELGPGLTVVTGETGAGKTMVVTALLLLRGARADPGAVRSGDTTARVEGVVRVDGLAPFAAAVDELGGVVEDDRVVLARNVAGQGRSRAFVGGAAVPAATLGDLVEPLVAVHGQSDQHRLLRASTQREALDRFAGAPVAALLDRWNSAYARLSAVESELVSVQATARERAREADLLRFGLAEVESVSPAPGEDVALAAEEQRLGAADTLRAAAEQAREILSSEHGAPDALGAVGQARRLLDGVHQHDPQAAELASRLAELSYLLSDLAADTASYAAGLDSDPVRLAAVSERRAALLGLTRKYGETTADVLAWAEESAARLVELDGTDDRIEALHTEREALRADLVEVGAALSEARSEAATRLSEAVTAELVTLAMPAARVGVVVRQVGRDSTATETEAETETGGRRPLQVGDRLLRPTPSGFDEVEFLLAPSHDAAPRPLHRGASGGELSRVMLALEVALAGTNPVPTFVFDEVDAGIGGRAAVEVGRRLALLARTAQVLVVTHLPQVAAYADRHIVVHKSTDGGLTVAGLSVLDDDERLRELSRMMAGMAESDSALAHARELLDSARSHALAVPGSPGASGTDGPGPLR